MNPGALIGLVGTVLALPLSDVPEPRQTGRILGTGTTAPTIVLTAPTGGWTVDRMVLVAGTVSDPTINPVTVSINADRYLLKTVNGAFQRKFPATSGKNAVVVQGTNAGGTGRAERTLYAQVPSVPVFLVLTSDTDGVYTDLHVYEPLPDAPDPRPRAATRRSTSSGRARRPRRAELLPERAGRRLRQPGYGPYLYTHASPPAGFTRVDVNYWPSGDKAHTVATLNVVLFEARRTRSGVA